MQTLDKKILDYHLGLNFSIKMEDDIVLMNPFQGNPELLKICQGFYEKYYRDHEPRFLILGINPGRLGAGATGIPFTDTKRLMENCGLPGPGFVTHEPSSVFVYKMIEAYGGPSKFYKNFYINSVFPLGFIKKNQAGKFVNFNYYDQKSLEKSLTPAIMEHIKNQIRLVQNDQVCFCLGRGKNYEFLSRLNQENLLFKEIIPLEHPRFIMQYKAKEMDAYIEQYLNAFSKFIK